LYLVRTACMIPIITRVCDFRYNRLWLQHTVVWPATYGPYSFFATANLTYFSQFSSISPGNFCIWVGFVFLSFPPHFTGSFGHRANKNHNFHRLFIIFIPITPIILSEKILIGKKTSTAGETTVSTGTSTIDDGFVLFDKRKDHIHLFGFIGVICFLEMDNRKVLEVDFHDAASQNRQPPKLGNRSRANVEFAVDQTVKVRNPHGTPGYKQGTIVRKDEDGTYDVNYEDGTIELNMRSARFAVPPVGSRFVIFIDYYFSSFSFLSLIQTVVGQLTLAWMRRSKSNRDMMKEKLSAKIRTEHMLLVMRMEQWKRNWNPPNW
jgi:hypothetical protein